MRSGRIWLGVESAGDIHGILDEALAVVDAEGITLPESNPREHIRDHCWERSNKPSMLQHIESGRETEIDALNGALVEKARLHGIATPINEVVVQVIKGREAALRAAGGKLAGSADESAGLYGPRNGRWGS